MEKRLDARVVRMKVKTILELNEKNARKLLLEEKNYSNCELPDYFSFDELLGKVSKKVGKTNIKAFFKIGTKGKKFLNPKDYENVNHLILANKDGELAWRPIEIIHPVLYVALVHLITEKSNWAFLRNRFADFKKTGILCESIPRKSETVQSHKSAQIKKWWERVEQESVKLGLDYQYVFDADISDCYGSIYTHSIAWALHSKKTSKLKKNLGKLLGDQIDEMVRMMRFGQTNGIPQGSMLMDFIAEIILGYVDELLLFKLKDVDIKSKDYKIIRYRDDYKVFTNKPEVGKCILKCLSEVLSSLGIKLNSGKTKQQNDPILASIKEDKIDELFVISNKKNLSKWLLQIYSTILKHPNSGKVPRQLSSYHEVLLWYRKYKKSFESYENPEVMISIIVNLAIKNPKYYNWSMAIMSIFIENCPKKNRVKILDKIIKKFDVNPNTGFLDIWLQRVSYKINPLFSFKEPLTALLNKPTHSGEDIWCSDWLDDGIKQIIVSTSLINLNKLAEKEIVIGKEEVALFNNDYN